MEAKDNVTITYEGNVYTYPLVRGVLGDNAIDISKLRDETGLITLDLGYKNTGSTKSAITYLNGDAGELYYRGYPIEQLADNSSFEEVIYLLLEGELPTQHQLDVFTKTIKTHSLVSEELWHILRSFPRSAHPMGILSALTSSLTAFNPDAVDAEDVEAMYQAQLNIIGKFPVLAAATYRNMMGYPLNYSKDHYNYASNFLQMMFALPSTPYDLDPLVAKALEILLILHADHEQNCSASTVRMVGSSQAGLFASISSGVSALWGQLHGGANQAVIEMLELIRSDGSSLKKWVDKAKDKNDPFRIMGFGHRVYKNFDPRSRIIKKATDQVLGKLGIEDPVLEIAKELEEIALKDDYFIQRKLYPNVDFYSGIIYRAIGIPKQMFTVMFALGRLPGWISQWKEMRLNKEPISRPRQVYVGSNTRDYVPIQNRG